MKKIILFMFLSLSILSACSPETETNPVYEGTVVYKTEENGKYKFLVLEQIGQEALHNGQLEDFIALAQKQPEASYYYVNKKAYETLDVGLKVKITAEVHQLESLPPIRTVVSIERLEQ
ncbi:DUF3221 domain-containing protein [Paenibacillus sp. TC-CSREp1]|uniref:DUF3221 domain-containing protein n=1 Tax=Paenibacillus sp. TC-CSREp1 TaxID=3410089 RepID=UPI003CF5ED59